MDPSVIAATVVSWLVPYLTKAGEVVGRKFGEQVYSTIKARAETRPAAKEAVNDLEKEPGSVDAQGALRLQIKKLLTEDPSFAAELEKMLQAGEASGAGPVVNVTADNRSVGAGRDVSGTIITGDVKGPITTDHPDKKPGA